MPEKGDKWGVGRLGGKLLCPMWRRDCSWYPPAVFSLHDPSGVDGRLAKEEAFLLKPHCLEMCRPVCLFLLWAGTCWGKNGCAAALSLEGQLCCSEDEASAVLWLGEPQVAMLGSGQGLCMGPTPSPFLQVVPQIILLRETFPDQLSKIVLLPQPPGCFPAHDTVFNFNWLIFT